jgi:hypothetical protein
MAHSHSGGAAVLAWALGATTAWSPVRFGFKGYGAQISARFRSKQRGAHRDAYLVQQTTSEAAIATRDGGAASLGSGNDGGSLRCSSDSKKWSGSFVARSSSSYASIVASDDEFSCAQRWLGF